MNKAEWRLRPNKELGHHWIECGDTPELGGVQLWGERGFVFRTGTGGYGCYLLDRSLANRLRPLPAGAEHPKGCEVLFYPTARQIGKIVAALQVPEEAEMQLVLVEAYGRGDSWKSELNRLVKSTTYRRTFPLSAPPLAAEEKL